MCISSISITNGFFFVWIILLGHSNQKRAMLILLLKLKVLNLCESLFSHLSMLCELCAFGPGSAFLQICDWSTEVIGFIHPSKSYFTHAMVGMALTVKHRFGLQQSYNDFNIKACNFQFIQAQDKWNTTPYKAQKMKCAYIPRIWCIWTCGWNCSLI